MLVKILANGIPQSWKLRGTMVCNIKKNVIYILQALKQSCLWNCKINLLGWVYKFTDNIRLNKK